MAKTPGPTRARATTFAGSLRADVRDALSAQDRAVLYFALLNSSSPVPTLVINDQRRRNLPNRTLRRTSLASKVTNAIQGLSKNNTYDRVNFFLLVALRCAVTFHRLCVTDA